jgi:SPP1 family predicted phage head-tail adaptor
MQAGKLSRRVTIQQKATTQDAYGQPVQTWTDVAEVWADIRDMSGKEYFAAQATQNPVQTKITIRYRAGIVPAMRVIYGSDTYNIEAVLGQDKISLLLMCSRGLNA